MKTVKLSFSILSAWSKGHFEDAVGMYLGKDLPATPAMELGKLKHKLWANYIQKHQALPAELGGGKLEAPIVEQKYQKLIPFSDKYRILLRGIIDLEDGEVITDHKCGIGQPGTYVESLQLDYYKLLRPQASLGQYLCHDPYKCDAFCAQAGYHACVSKGVKFLTRANAEAALNHLVTYGGELIEYLEANRLLRDYKEKI